jgi:hypothetical protein
MERAEGTARVARLVADLIIVFNGSIDLLFLLLITAYFFSADVLHAPPLHTQDERVEGGQRGQA